jgi:hypothetical protein
LETVYIVDSIILDRPKYTSQNMLDVSPESKNVKRHSAVLTSPDFSDKDYYPAPAGESTRYHKTLNTE